MQSSLMMFANGPKTATKQLAPPQEGELATKAGQLLRALQQWNLLQKQATQSPEPTPSAPDDDDVIDEQALVHMEREIRLMHDSLIEIKNLAITVHLDMQAFNDMPQQDPLGQAQIPQTAFPQSCYPVVPVMSQPFSMVIPSAPQGTQTLAGQAAVQQFTQQQ
jgi:hypothetical protein